MLSGQRAQLFYLDSAARKVSPPYVSVVSSGVGRVLLVAGAGFEPATFRL